MGKDLQEQEKIFHINLSSTAIPTPGASWRCVKVNPQQKSEMAASRTVLNCNQGVSKVDLCISQLPSPYPGPSPSRLSFPGFNQFPLLLHIPCPMSCS